MSTTLTAEDVELTIDEEFAEIFGAETTESDVAALRTQIEKDGVFRQDIFYWTNDGKNLIVDGMTRYSIWKALPPGTPIPPPHVTELFFPDRAAAKAAIESEQASRRNLKPKRRTELLTKLYGKKKRSAAGRPKSTKNTQENAQNQKGKNGVTRDTISGRSADRVANETGVSASTVNRASAYESALSAIRGVNGKAASDIESGTLKVSQNDVRSIGKLDQAGISTALKNLRNGQKWNHSESPLDNLAEDVRDAIEKGKLKANATQIAALSEYEEESQVALVESVIEGKQSLGKAIETGEVPEPTPDEIMAEVNSSIESFCRQIVKFFDENCPDDPWLQDLHRRDAALQKLKDSCSTLRTAKCSHLCPLCEAEGCPKCKKTGRVPKAVYDQMQ